MARSLSAITNQQPLVSFYGTACTLPYSTVGACKSPTTGSYCGNSALSACYLNGTNTNAAIADPTAPPSCHCPSGSIGQWCDASPCNPTSPPGLDCTHDPFNPTGVCEGYTDCPTHDFNCFTPTCTTSNCQWKCRCYYVDPSNGYHQCDNPLQGISSSPTCVYYSNQNPWDPNSVPGVPCIYPLTNCSYYNSALSIPKWTVCGYLGQSACVANMTSNTLSCNCTGSGYTGTYCQTPLACGGYCTNGKCVNGVCNCLTSYTGITTGCTSSQPCCNTPACGGSLPGTLSGSSCVCPRQFSLHLSRLFTG
ncbi:unnamed protein product [Sphagnum balticum]